MSRWGRGPFAVRAPSGEAWSRSGREAQATDREDVMRDANYWAPRQSSEGSAESMALMGESEKVMYAGLVRRVAALVVDLLVLSTFFTAVTRLTRGIWFLAPEDHRWSSGWFVTDPLCLSFLLTMFLYFFLFEGLAGATPGKRAFRLRVTDAQGGRPGLRRSLLRNFLRVVDALPTLGILGAILIVTSRERVRFGDRLAETRVVVGRRT